MTTYALENTATYTENLTELKITNKDLLKEIDLIVSCGNDIQKMKMTQFKSMQRIIDGKLYHDDFLDVDDLGKLDEKKQAKADKQALERFCRDVFGIEVSYAYKMANVARNFITDNYTSIFIDENGNDFKTTALIEMLPKDAKGDTRAVTKEQIVKMVENGTITSDDTVSDIKEHISKLRGTEKKPETKNVASKKETLSKLIDDLEAYGKKKKDKYIEVLVSKMRECNK